MGNVNNQATNNAPQQSMADYVHGVVDSAKDAFERISKETGLNIKFYEEAIYTQQLIEANYNNAKDKKYCLINATPQSIQKALVLVANSGLTLNPQAGLAYLVPRWNKNIGSVECHLEPSYKGLRLLGMDSGAISMAVTELVYSNDNFQWVDKFSKPLHNYDPFSESRGHIIGGYCLAKLPDDSYLCTPVNMTHINKVQALSFGNVWKDWEEQMISKTILRQGYKEWPITSTGPIARRLATMQEYVKDVDIKTVSADELTNEASNTEHLLSHENAAA